MINQVDDISLASLVNRRKVEEDKIWRQNEGKPTEIFNRILGRLYDDPMRDIEMSFPIQEWNNYGRKTIQLCKQYGLVVIESVPNQDVHVSVSIPGGV